MTNYNQGKVFKSYQEKKPEDRPLRYSHDSFVKELIGKVIKISFLNGKEIQGRLIELGMYDVLMQTSQARVIVMKSAIITVEVVQ